MATQYASAAEKLHSEDSFCAEKWRSLLKDHRGDWQRLRTEWTSLEPKCSKSGSYEYHLASIEEKVGNRDAGIRILETALKQRLPYHDPAYTNLLGMRFRKAFLTTPPDLVSCRKIAAELEKFVAEKPDFSFAITELANEKLMLEDYAGSVTVARKAIAVDSTDSNARRALIIALGRLGKYHEARIEIDPALTANRALVADPELMYVVSTVYLELGDTESAEKALLLLLETDSQLRSNPEFVDRANRVIAVKKKAGK